MRLSVKCSYLRFDWITINWEREQIWRYDPLIIGVDKVSRPGVIGCYKPTSSYDIHIQGKLLLVSRRSRDN